MGASARLYSLSFVNLAPGVSGEMELDTTITGADFEWLGFTWNDGTKKVSLAFDLDNERIFEPEFVPVQNLIVDRGNGFFFKEPISLPIGKKVRLKVRSDEVSAVEKFVVSLVGNPVLK